MTYLQSYKELIVWQKSMELAREIYLLTKNFPKSELYGIVMQIRRAVVSIPSNIAEGYGRKSTKEFIQFSTIAYGSLLELETQLILSKQLKFVEEIKFIRSEQLLEEISKMLRSMIMKLKTKSLSAIR
ncbi:MAG: S23 ribosomal protein [Candidatus Gottesmanbacteria bacterium GW2011_GWA1_34_13]|uniref:S23 ribosomal protein n=1 Tax=Candidatus Gottesmanbacteria bacterium GW2011_GWA1_34_13 TaxID=1618434 RepID=A0A0G0DVR6_9BACT|nr:MAG: S23 ribosomal protein [Candidatus Gottesmanbacteria bacterium GW2011_GWA1_34_13]